MTLTFSTFDLEITSRSLFVSLGGREVFIQRGNGLPFWRFSRERSGTDIEVWGLGLYGVVSRA